MGADLLSRQQRTTVTADRLGGVSAHAMRGTRANFAAALRTAGIASQPNSQLLCVQSRREEMPLGMVAAHAGEHAKCRVIVNALGHYVEPELMREGDDRFDEPLV
jgi:hypothetical protein